MEMKHINKDMKRKFEMCVFMYVDGDVYSLGYDFNNIDGPLTEEKFEDCYMALKPSMAKVLRDHNKIVNPWG